MRVHVWGACAWPVDGRGEAGDPDSSPSAVPKGGGAAALSRVKSMPAVAQHATGGGGGGDAACAGDFCGFELARCDDGVFAVVDAAGAEAASAALASVSAKSVLLARRCASFIVRASRCVRCCCAACSVVVTSDALVGRRTHGLCRPRGMSRSAGGQRTLRCSGGSARGYVPRVRAAFGVIVRGAEPCAVLQPAERLRALLHDVRVRGRVVARVPSTQRL